MGGRFFQVTYRMPCDVTRGGPSCWTRQEAEAHAAELRRIHPDAEVWVSERWESRCVDGFASGD